VCKIANGSPVVLCDTHDTSILIVDNYATMPVSPRSRCTAVYRSSTKYRETAQVSRVSLTRVTSKTAINQNGLDQNGHTQKRPQTKTAKNQYKTATMLVNIIC